MLPAVIEAGVVSLKIEGRQRTKSYVATVTRILRQAVDSYYDDPASFHPKGKWIKELNATSEGATHTLGTYEQGWQ